MGIWIVLISGRRGWSHNEHVCAFVGRSYSATLRVCVGATRIHTRGLAWPRPHAPPECPCRCARPAVTCSPRCRQTLEVAGASPHRFSCVSMFDSVFWLAFIFSWWVEKSGHFTSRLVICKSSSGKCLFKSFKNVAFSSLFL